MRVPLLLLALGGALAACSGAPADLSVDHGYVRLSAVPRSPAAAYFTIHGGPTDTTLLSVSTDVAIRTEMHESMMSGSMSSMKPLDTLQIPARTDTVFKPGGRHVMLFDWNPGIKPGRKIALTFTFSNGQKLVYQAPSIAAGGAPPKE